MRNISLQKYGLDRYLAPIEELGDRRASNAAIYELIKDIPNVTWVDATQYLGKQIYAEGKLLYSDQDHFTAFGSYYLGVLFHQHERILGLKDVEILYSN